MMVLLCIMGVTLFSLIVVALTYDKTVTPAINKIKKIAGSLSRRFSNHQEIEAHIIAEFRLYDEATIMVAPIALAYLTYGFFSSEMPFYFQELTLVLVIWISISILFKVRKVIIFNNNTIRFQGVVRNIDMDLSEITEIQDWFIFVRVKYNNRSLILSPYIDKSGEFKTTIKKLNAEAQMKDMSNAFFSPEISVACLILMLLFFWAY